MNDLHWFDLSKYDEVKNFTAQDWRFHLGLRMCGMTNGNSPQEITIKNQLANRVKVNPMSKMNHVLGSPYGKKGVMETNKDSHVFQDFPTLAVNPQAADQQIIKDFTEWLSNYRKATDKKAPKNEFKQSDFDKWEQYKILPYLDLTVICEVENVQLTQSKAASLLFKYRVDNVEFLRKTVKPLALKLISRELLWALDAQTAVERRKNMDLDNLPEDIINNMKKALLL